MRILTIIGARPQFIKAASVSRAVAKRNDIQEILLNTGQHFDPEMSDIFFKELEIPEPKYNLGIHGGGHGNMTGRMLIAIEEVFLSEKPDWVLVYGDTNSTLAGALTAAKFDVPLAHVEAGLRSYNRRMPEEINRVVTDHVSKLLFCPTTAAIQNLAREGIVTGVHHTGDVMYDAMLHARTRSKLRSTILERLSLLTGRYAVATIHRAENTDDPAQLTRVLSWLLKQAKDQQIVVPLHPRTRQAINRIGMSIDGLTIVPPVGYLDMASLLDGASAVFTDSGGLQKEAYFYGKRCVTLREETEWVETVEYGWNRLWTEPSYKPRRPIVEYGKGTAAEVMLALMAGDGTLPAPPSNRG